MESSIVAISVYQNAEEQQQKGQQHHQELQQISQKQIEQSQQRKNNNQIQTLKQEKPPKYQYSLPKKNVIYQEKQFQIQQNQYYPQSNQQLILQENNQESANNIDQKAHKIESINENQIKYQQIGSVPYNKNATYYKRRRHKEKIETNQQVITSNVIQVKPAANHIKVQQIQQSKRKLNLSEQVSDQDAENSQQTDKKNLNFSTKQSKTLQYVEYDEQDSNQQQEISEQQQQNQQQQQNYDEKVQRSCQRKMKRETGQKQQQEVHEYQKRPKKKYENKTKDRKSQIQKYYKKVQKHISFKGTNIYELSYTFLPPNFKVKCIIKETKSFFSGDVYDFYLQDDKRHFLRATRGVIPLSSKFQFFDLKSKKKIGQMFKNFTGTEFVLYKKSLSSIEYQERQYNSQKATKTTGKNSQKQQQKNQDQFEDQIAWICYTPNLFGLSGQRHLNIAKRLKKIPKTQRFSDLKSCWQEGDRTKIQILSHKLAQKRNGSYQLNFHGVVKMPSSKNIIIQDEKGSQSLIFGKRSQNIYSMHISHPLSLIQGFAIGVSNLDNKLIVH